MAKCHLIVAYRRTYQFCMVKRHCPKHERMTLCMNVTGYRSRDDHWNGIHMQWEWEGVKM